MGVEQVVDGDEVEACGELQPERRLGDRAEQQHEQNGREPGEAQNPVRDARQ